jgi:hypothetical protein
MPVICLSPHFRARGVVLGPQRSFQWLAEKTDRRAGLSAALPKPVSYGGLKRFLESRHNSDESGRNHRQNSSPRHFLGFFHEPDHKGNDFLQ